MAMEWHWRWQRKEENKKKSHNKYNYAAHIQETVRKIKWQNHRFDIIQSQ